MNLPTRTARAYLRVLQLAALIGFVLSVIGWVAVSLQRVLLLTGGVVRFPGNLPWELDALLFLLDGMKEAAAPLFLSAILAAVCHIALKLTPDTTPPAED